MRRMAETLSITLTDLADGDDKVAVLAKLANARKEEQVYVGVHGNRSAEVATANLKYLIPHAVGLLTDQLETPCPLVFQGVNAPAGGKPFRLTDDSIEYQIHGNLGFDGVDATVPQGIDSLKYYQSISGKNVHVLSLGATSDLPRLVETVGQTNKIELVTCMAGAIGTQGNVGPYMEANAWRDPLATIRTLAETERQGIPTVLVDLGCTEHSDALFTPGLVAKLKAHLLVTSPRIWTSLSDVMCPGGTYYDFYRGQAKHSAEYPWRANQYMGLPVHDVVAAAVEHDYLNRDGMYKYQDVRVQADLLGNIGVARDYMQPNFPVTLVRPARPKLFHQYLVSSFEAYQ